MIQVKNIVKTYGDHKAVDHLSFSLEKGKIYGFLGPNGAGKSTTMNIMTGYIAPNEGSVTINGHDILKDAESAKKHIGYLPEMPPLYTDMTIREYLDFAMELKKVPKKERRDQISKILKMTMLGEYEDRVIRNLSKGYKQRVGLAQALVGFPEVIILDEPTVGLDPQQIIEIRSLIRSLKEDHIVILSSHILSEINEVCDDVMIISHGKLVEQGTPEELEAKFQGKERINMAILGNPELIKSTLEAIDSISDISISEEPDTQGSYEVSVTNGEAGDIRTDVAKALALAGLPVLSMEVEKKTLEDVFLEVTSQTPAYDQKEKKQKKHFAEKNTMLSDTEKSTVPDEMRTDRKEKSLISEANEEKDRHLIRDEKGNEVNINRASLEEGEVNE
ncbi:ABC transporter ATP-binding protein [Butyrivibrio sp. AE3004]|uniref:ABC transporter ATP-binding protein n=1 Tax=Butyrivibrio sp. AE3004 TaxID=1506994 RepID=UPI000691B288|nr:ABC transporter ATP-binding protein [Butyrivibrio sp. AE3004]